MSARDAWAIAAAHPPLGAEAHVWRVPLDVGEADVAAHRALLSEDERAKADRFYFDRDRRKYTVARGTLRTLLARYFSSDPRAFTFAYGERGKPSIEGDVRFNVSHSGEVALLAFARGVELGVDVEQVRADIDIPGLARISFSPEERAALFACPVEERLTAFYALWTRKEAYIKAIGLGLAMPLDGFTVTCTPEATLVRVESDPREAAHWRMWSFDAGADYPCALAARDPSLRVAFFAA